MLSCPFLTCCQNCHADVSPSVLSDHSTGFERKTRTEFKKLFSLMFGPDAFTEDVDAEETNRKFSLKGTNYEIDYCSTLHVHEGLTIRDRPPKQMAKMRFLEGNWDSWLQKIVQKYTQEQAGQETLQRDLTPTKTSARATHYIVGETKISLGKNSIIQRLHQLERNVKMLCNNKDETANQVPVKAVGIIALAGIGVPPNRQFDDQSIIRMIKTKRKNLPILRRLLQEERVFVFEIDSFHVRLEQMEEGLEKVDEKLEKLDQKLEELKKLLLMGSGGN